MSLRFRFVDETGVTSLNDAQHESATGAVEMMLATAFLTEAGAKMALALAGRLRGRNRRARVVAGMSGCITEPQALWALHRDKSIELRVATSPAFHVKLYLFRAPKALRGIVGSANYTAKGLAGVGEVLALLEDRAGSDFDKQATDVFRRIWDAASPSTEAMLREYGSGWKRPTRQTLPAGVAKALARERTRAEKARETRVARHFWYPTGGYVSTKTARDLASRGSWEGRGDDGVNDAELFGSSTQDKWHDVSLGDFVWHTDFALPPAERALGRYRVVGKCIEATHDGRYWLSAVPVGSPVPLTGEALQKFKEVDLVRSWRPIDGAVRSVGAGKLRKLESLVSEHGKKNRRRKKVAH